MSTAVAPISGTSTWNLDATHTSVGFSVKHLMISTVRGHFSDITGTVITGDSDLANAKVDVRIATGSVDTRAEQRDAHLRSADFFDAEAFPEITFTSKRVEKGGKADFRLVGDLTIRGITREIALDVADEGRGTDPWGGSRAAFSLRGKLNRNDFGLTWNQALEAGGVLVSDEVKIEAEVQFVKA